MSPEEKEPSKEEAVDDPIELSATIIHGFRYPFFNALNEKNFDEFREKLKFQDGDIILVSYPKSGNHWMYGYLGMMKKRSQEIVRVKGGLIESFCDVQRIESCPEPRIFFTHIPYHHLPQEILENKKIKIFLLIRNPKDTVVSYYHHYLKMPVLNKIFTGLFSTFVSRWMEGEIDYQSWFDYYRPYYENMVGRENLRVIQYEKMKSEFLPNLRKIADFLKMDFTDEYLRLIEEKTSISRMTEWATSAEAVTGFKPMHIFYRKGVVGDWKSVMDEETAKKIDDKFEKLKPILQGWEDFQS